MPESSSRVKTALTVATVLARALEDVETAFIKVMEEHNNQLGYRNMIRQIKDGRVTCLYMEGVDAKRLAEKMNERFIPFMQYQSKSGSKEMFFIPDEYADLVIQMEKNIRIYAGLEIDQKSELDKAIYEMESPENRYEYVIRGLNEYEATRIVQMASTAKPKFLAVSEKQEDGTYLVASHIKRASQLNQYAVNAMLESNNPNPIMNKVKDNEIFWNMQKASFQTAVEDMRTDRCEEAYLFSTKEPGKYMHIYQSGYEIVNNGIVTNRDSASGVVRGSDIALSPGNYADRAWLFGNSIEDFVYVKASEVDAYENGAPQFINEALPSYPKRMHPHMVKGEKQFTELVDRFINAKSGAYWIDSENYRLDIKMLMNDFKTEIQENEALSERDKQMALKKAPYFEQALTGFLSEIKSGDLSAAMENVKVSGDEIISVAQQKAAMKSHAAEQPQPIEEPIYDEKIIKDILDGTHIDTGDSDIEEKVQPEPSYDDTREQKQPELIR